MFYSKRDFYTCTKLRYLACVCIYRCSHIFNFYSVYSMYCLSCFIYCYLSGVFQLLSELPTISIIFATCVIYCYIIVVQTVEKNKAQTRHTMTVCQQKSMLVTSVNPRQTNNCLTTKDNTIDYD